MEREAATGKDRCACPQRSRESGFLEKGEKIGQKVGGKRISRERELVNSSGKRCASFSPRKAGLLQ